MDLGNCHVAQFEQQSHTDMDCFGSPMRLEDCIGQQDFQDEEEEDCAGS